MLAQLESWIDRNHERNKVWAVKAGSFAGRWVTRLLMIAGCAWLVQKLWD